jgi:hypothetical protein
MMLEKDILVYHYPKIEGVRIVKGFAPRTISKAELPMVVLFADTLEAVERTGSSTTKYRTIRAVLFVDIIGMGTENSPYEKTDPFFDRVDTYFEARPALALEDGTTALIHDYMGDEGETVTPYPTGDKVSQFWAITFKHRFTIVKPVIFQPGG